MARTVSERLGELQSATKQGEMEQSAESIQALLQPQAAAALLHALKDARPMPGAGGRGR